jgi:hypothetical protein
VSQASLAQGEEATNKENSNSQSHLISREEKMEGKKKWRMLIFEADMRIECMIQKWDFGK